MNRWKKYTSLLLALVLCLSLVACGSSGREWSDTDVIDACGTVERDGEQIDVCVCHDRKAVYLYYNDENHELFDTAMLPTDEIYDEDWNINVVDFSDLTDDNNGDLQVFLAHADMSESHIVWKWEEGAGYIYQPNDSYFYESRVVYDPNEDTSSDDDGGGDSELRHQDISVFQGTWYYDDDPSAETYIVIDGHGNWSYYQRAPGAAEGTKMDYGTFSYSTEYSYVYDADSAMYDDVSYQVLDFDDNILVWGDEGAYYRMK